MIGNDIAYLNVSTTGQSLRRALNGQLAEARQLFRGARALVIDLSKNYGGWDYIARHLVSRFTSWDSECVRIGKLTIPCRWYALYTNEATNDRATPVNRV